MAFAQNDFHDGISWTGAVTANTVGPFYLLGGRYEFAVTTPSTSSTLQQLMPDGTSYVTVLPIAGVNPIVTATVDPTSFFDLPPGTYKVITTEATGNAGFVIRVPYRAA